MEWQTILAVSIVVLTAAIFVFRLARRSQMGGGGGCSGCDHNAASPPFPVSKDHPAKKR